MGSFGWSGCSIVEIRMENVGECTLLSVGGYLAMECEVEERPGR